MSAISDYQAYAAQQAQANGVPVNMFLWQIGQESSWIPTAQNGDHIGLGQFDTGTAGDFNLTNRTDPYASIAAAAQYDAKLYNQTGSWQGALTKYGTLANASPTVMQQFQNALNGAPQTAAQSLAYYQQNGYPYTPPAAAGSAAATVQNATSGFSANIEKYINQGTFIILGIVVVAFAIMSNKQVQTVAVNAAKG